MKKKLPKSKMALIILMCGFSSMAVTANDGTISFEGSISAATCDISGGDEASPNQGKDFKVTLPTVSTTALAAAGKVAGDTPFFINLSGENCQNNKIANVIFERVQSTTIDSEMGYLKNTESSGGAENVFIRILNFDKNPLNLNEANTDHQKQTIASNKATFKYWSQYIAVGGAAKAGSVKSNVVYSISYR